MPPKSNNIDSPSSSIGAIYIDGNEFKGITDFVCEFSTVKEYIKDNLIYNPVKLEFISKVNMHDFYKFIGFYDWVIRNCPNKKVVHLIKNGKNYKIKKKNFNRAIKIISKELNNVY